MMDARHAEMYWRAMTVIEAREALLQMEITSVPHMNKDSARKTESRLKKAAFPKKQYMDPAHLKQLMAQLGR
jgi:hypothetical protein